MKINPDRTSVPEIGKTKKVGKASEKPAADISRPATGDKVRLSSRAREIHEIKTKINSLPEVREDRVRELRDAIHSGRYRVSGDEVAKKLIRDSFPGTDE